MSKTYVPTSSMRSLPTYLTSYLGNSAIVIKSLHCHILGVGVIIAFSAELILVLGEFLDDLLYRHRRLLIGNVRGRLLLRSVHLWGISGRTRCRDGPAWRRHRPLVLRQHRQRQRAACHQKKRSHSHLLSFLLSGFSTDSIHFHPAPSLLSSLYCT